MNKITTLLLAWLLLGLATTAWAQVPAAAGGTGSLTGTVLDSLTRQPVAYATVVLLPPAPSDKPITGVAADDQGKFALTKLAAGAFRLRVLYVGYAARTRPVTVGPGATALGPVLLPSATTALAEAVVVGQKPVVEVKPDRLVYNADQDVSNAGGTAQDVLRKAPLLAVDGDGNVTMRGSNNYKVLVNNKPSPTLAKNLAEALKAIPAENIQSVEVITTPSAKYDGEGTAGIINIVLKKGTKQAANGRISASSGNRNSNFNSSLNFRRGKLNFTSSANAGLWYNPGRAETYRQSYSRFGTDTLRQNSTNFNRGRWFYGTLGLDYDLNEHNSLSLASSIDGYGGSSTSNLLNSYVSPVPSVASQLFTRDTKSTFGGTSFETTGTYTRTFAQARREFSALVQYALTPGNFGYDYNQYDNVNHSLEPSQASRVERSRGRTPGHEITLQTDYTHPFGDKNKLEVGLKGIFRRTGSVATVDTLGSRYGRELAPDPSRATDFRYNQDVQAAYAIYSFGVGKKLTASVGSRLERTGISAEFRTTNSMLAPRSYYTPLPNAFAQYSLGEASSLRLAYSRRITRPFIDYLNPFVNRAQAGVISYGNPALDPELTDSYELSYNTSVKTTSLNASLSVRHTGNAIEGISLPTDSSGVIANTFANVASNTYYQFNVFGSFKPTANWNLSLGPDVQYITLRSPALQAERRGFTAGLNFNTSYKLTKTLTLQSFAFASTPRPSIQGTSSANLYYQIGAKKTFLNEKLDVTLNFGSPFNQRWPYRNTTSTPFFDQRSTYYAYQRSFRFTLGYRFGQEQAGRQRKSIQNDDTKGGGSRQGG
jgi:outer membrane receptor protein involved in Fe transport